MDITQLIAEDHIEQRRLFALIDDLGSNEKDTKSAKSWKCPLPSAQIWTHQDVEKVVDALGLEPRTR